MTYPTPIVVVIAGELQAYPTLEEAEDAMDLAENLERLEGTPTTPTVARRVA